MTAPTPPPSQPPSDPLAPWREMQTAWMQSWAKAMNGVVNSDEFARTLGQSAEAMSPASEPVRKQMEAAFERYLIQMRLPTQGEMTGLAERLTNLEMRADDLDAKLDQALDQLAAIRALLEAPPPARKKTAAPRGKKTEQRI